MAGGEIVVEGDVGIQAGPADVRRPPDRRRQCRARGRRPAWRRDDRDRGYAGDRLGGPLAGETSGMRGGVVVVRGDVGERAGDRMRRGTIIVEGRAGDHAGSRMIAGTC